MKKLNLNEIIVHHNFPKDKYYQKIYNKKQIVIHHTVSGKGVKGDINWWESGRYRISTAFIIDYLGNINQLFSSKYWANHLGIKRYIFDNLNIEPINTKLNQESIAIEIDSWGGLVKNEKNNLWYPGKYDEKLKKYVPRTNLKNIPISDIMFYPNGYRNYFAYERYTDAQIEKVRQLLVYLTDKYNIPKTYNSNMWYVCPEALIGTPGIYSHSSYRADKSDAHPQDNLIKIIQNL